MIDIDQALASLSALEARLNGMKNVGASAFAAANQGALTLTQRADAMEKKFGGASRAMLGFGGAILAAFGGAIKVAGDFESEMSAVFAVTDATTKEQEALRQKALQLGKDTVFSASEAATAIEELGKGGVSVEDIINGAADAVTNLAAASGTDLATAATITAAAMNQFGIDGSQAVAIADLLARGANTSAADAQTLGESLAYVGTQAAALNIPIETVVAALSEMADQGIVGSRAGTSLNEMLLGLAHQTGPARDEMDALGLSFKDAQGNLLPLPDIIADVSAATADMGDADRAAALDVLFGVQGGRAMNALLTTQTDAAKAAGKSWDDYATNVTSGATASETAQKRLDNFNGSLEQFKGSLETMAITVGSLLLPAMRDAVDGLTGLVNRFLELPAPMQEVIAAAGLVAGAMTFIGGGLLFVIPKIMKTVDSFLALSKALNLVTLSEEGALVGLSGIGIAIVAIAAVLALLAVAYKTNFLGFGDAVDAVWAKVSTFFSDFWGWYQTFRAMGIDPVTAAFDALGTVLESLTGIGFLKFFQRMAVAVNRFPKAITKVAKGFRDMGKAILAGDWNTAFQKLRSTLAGIGDFLAAPAKLIGDFFKGISTGFAPLDAVIHLTGRLFTDFGRLIQEVFQGDFRGALTVGERLLRHFADLVGALFSLAWEGIKLGVGGIVDVVEAVDWGAVATTIADTIGDLTVDLALWTLFVGIPTAITWADDFLTIAGFVIEQSLVDLGDLTATLGLWTLFVGAPTAWQFIGFSQVLAAFLIQDLLAQWDAIAPQLAAWTLLVGAPTAWHFIGFSLEILRILIEEDFRNQGDWSDLAVLWPNAWTINFESIPGVTLAGGLATAVGAEVQNGVDTWDAIAVTAKAAVAIVFVSMDLTIAAVAAGIAAALALYERTTKAVHIVQDIVIDITITAVNVFDSAGGIVHDGLAGIGQWVQNQLPGGGDGDGTVKGAPMDISVATTVADINTEAWDNDYAALFADVSAINGTTATAKAALNINTFQDNYDLIMKPGGLGDQLNIKTWTATGDLDINPFEDNYDVVMKPGGLGDTFDAKTWMATFGVDLTPVYIAYSEAFRLGSIWDAQTFTATFSVTQQTTVLPPTTVAAGPSLFAMPDSGAAVASADVAPRLFAPAGMLMGAGGASTFTVPVGGGRATVSPHAVRNVSPTIIVEQRNFALSTSDLEQLLREAETGADFARVLTRELDLRREG